MKTEIVIPQQPRTFVPFTLKVTFENESDVKEYITRCAWPVGNAAFSAVVSEAKRQRLECVVGSF